MAQNLLVTIALFQSYSGNYLNGKLVKTYWDDVTSQFVVTTQVPGGSPTTETSGPDLGQLKASQVTDAIYDNSSVNRQTGEVNAPKFFDSLYKFCSGVNLNTFRGVFNNPSYPYVTQTVTPNASECAVQVCDLAFTGFPVVVPPTNNATIDGSITVFATSSHGPVLYALADLPYATMSNSTGIFTGLSMGLWTIYARDVYNCKAQLPIFLRPSITTNVKYRLDYHDVMNNAQGRVDILERNYDGNAITPICGDQTIQISKPVGTVNNKLDCLNPTSAIITLVSQKNFQYMGLYTQDDRKYLIKFYKPIGTLIWTGYVIPSVYSEQYKTVPYYTSLTATDGLSTLTDFDFADDDGNKLSGKKKLIEIIAFILNKLELNIPIKVAINMYASGFAVTAADDPLDQAYINDMIAFYDNGTPWRCDKVLKAILEPFGAKIIQDNGYWNIIHVEEQTANYKYRIFSTLGVYQSNGTSNHLVDINDPTVALGALFANQNQNLDIIPAFGKIILVHNLKERTNLLTGGDFDISDWNGSFFNGWNIDLTNGGGVIYTVSKIIQDPLSDAINNHQVIGVNPTPVTGERWGIIKWGFDPKFFVSLGGYALRMSNFDDGNFLFTTGLGRFVGVNSDLYPIEFINDSISLSFNYRINLHQYVTSYLLDAFSSPLWIRIRWSVMLVDPTNSANNLFYHERSGWVDITAPNLFFNEIYESVFNADQTKKLTIQLPVEAALTTKYSLQVRFIFEGSSAIDATSFADLQNNYATFDLPLGWKKKVGVTTSYSHNRGRAGGINSTIVHYYNLRAGTDATSSPNILRPSDYNGATNAVVWELERKDNATTPVENIYLNSVILSFLPGNFKAPPIETLQVIVNPNYKEQLGITIDAGDLPDTQINSAKHIYDNYFMNSSDVPTSGWSRSYLAESTTIQKILLKTLVGQYNKPTFKISGNFIGKTDLTPTTVLKHSQAPSAITVLNQEFATNTVWSNSTGSSWAISGGQAVGTFASVLDSNYFIQSGLTLPAGTRISIETALTRSGGNLSRVDQFVAVLFSGATLLQKVILIDAISADSSRNNIIRFTIGQDCDTIGFGTKNLTGSGSLVYSVDYFRVVALTLVKYYQFSRFDRMDKSNMYSLELQQLIPPIASADPTIDDTGAGDTAGSGIGVSSGGDYNNDYNNDFN